ncbi:MAG: hypothetical protein U0Y82_02225 [Thermoleophilia bacterium]
MSVLERLNVHAGRVAGEVQSSLRRARAEGERRLLVRQHRAALEELGERVYELVQSGALPREPLETQLAQVERKLMEIEAKAAEMDEAARAAEGGEVEEPPAAASGAGPGWDAAQRFFPKSR